MENDKLFITRKRKKWKFAHFDEWPNCFQQDEVDPAQWKKPLTVEIAAGSADLSVELAKQYPRRHFVGVDIKSDRLYTGAKRALEKDIKNIAFVRAQLDKIEDLFARHSIKELWITFPDPFPRKKQAKHRLTHPSFLQQYRNILDDGGIIRFKTDNRELFLWSLEQLIAQNWDIKELNFDLHESDLPDEYKITTYYERRFMAEGTPINYVSATPR
ncbi:MAG: tRNA (guanosine(46)-N7)-methyltransferase TrmB [Candidatus Saccharimonadales bacterium]